MWPVFYCTLINYYLFIFACPKTNPKGQPHHLVFGVPALLEVTERCETRFAQTVGVYAIVWLRLPLALFYAKFIPP